MYEGKIKNKTRNRLIFYTLVLIYKISLEYGFIFDLKDEVYHSMDYNVFKEIYTDVLLFF